MFFNKAENREMFASSFKALPTASKGQLALGIPVFWNLQEENRDKKTCMLALTSIVLVRKKKYQKENSASHIPQGITYRSRNHLSRLKSASFHNLF